MNPEKDYLAINKALWNKKTSFHVNSTFYNNQEFIKGKSSLNSIELDLLGNVKGKSILHLQCHFGQDSISLARLGAKVTGIDLSDKAIEAACDLALKTKSEASFICSDIYDLPNHLNQKFDIVFTSYGTIGWLPDLDKWATVVSHFLKPKGRFVFAEFHPFVWMFDNEMKSIIYNYFKDEPIIELNTGTYADRDSKINLEEITWNHSISEVLTSLFKQNIKLESFHEHNYTPYNCFSGMEEFETGKFRFKVHQNKLPLVYSLAAIKGLE